MSSMLICGSLGGLDDSAAPHAEGCDFDASRWGDPAGVCVPDGGLEGARDGTVWLSGVNRSEVIMTCGTWYVLCRTWMAAARESRSVIEISDNSLHNHISISPF